MTIFHPPLSDQDREGFIRSLLAEAERGREFACSWRNYRVGAAAAGLIKGKMDSLVPFQGCNIKLCKNSGGNKFCAEPIALGAAIAAGCAEIAALAVVGEPESTNDDTPTLHPCRDCLQLLYDLKQHGKLAPDFFMVTAWKHACEQFTLAELLALHPL